MFYQPSIDIVTDVKTPVWVEHWTNYKVFEKAKEIISELIEVFKDEPLILDILYMIENVGLSYLKLGQSATTLSGGEAQRIKLAKELYKKQIKDVIYILDEPTTGLHDEDIDRLISVLKALNEKGATILVIEHNAQLIEICDRIIELGPGGGCHGLV